MSFRLFPRSRRRCNRCHRPMTGSTAYDGACACGGLIEAVRTPERSAPRAPARGAAPSPSRVQSLAAVARLRITALSGLRDNDKLDLPQVEPKNAEN